MNAADDFQGFGLSESAPVDSMPLDRAQPRGRLPLTTPLLRSTYRKGRAAAKAGSNRECPYPVDGLTQKVRRAWLQGWDDQTNARTAVAP